MRNLIIATASASAIVLMAGSVAFAGDSSTSVTPAQPQGYYYGPKAGNSDTGMPGTTGSTAAIPGQAPDNYYETSPNRPGGDMSRTRKSLELPGLSGSSGEQTTATGSSKVYPLTPEQQKEYKAQSPDESGGGMDHTRQSLPNTAGTQ